MQNEGNGEGFVIGGGQESTVGVRREIGDVVRSGGFIQPGLQCGTVSIDGPAVRFSSFATQPAGGEGTDEHSWAEGPEALPEIWGRDW